MHLNKCNKRRAYPGSEFVVASTLAEVLARKQYQEGSCCSVFNRFLASGDFCHLLITFAISLDPDQAQQNLFGQNIYMLHVYLLHVYYVFVISSHFGFMFPLITM